MKEHGGPNRARQLAIAGLLVVVLTVASVPVLGMVAYGPAQTVSAYFDALDRRDAEAAVGRLLTGEITDGWALTDEALDGAPSLPTRVSVTHAETDGDRATATVEYDLDGTTRTQDFSLVRTPGTWGLFPVWLIDPGTLPRMDLVVDGASTVRINSADVPAPRDGLPVLYPVEYSVGFAEHYFRSGVQNTVVDGSAPEVEVRLAAEPTEDLRDEVDDLVRAHLDGCATATTLMPAGCTFGFDSVNQILGDVSWEIVEYPEVRLSTERRRLVTAPTEGVARVSGRYRDIVTATESDFDEPITFTFTAVVSVVDGEPRVEPLEAGLASGDGLGSDSDEEPDDQPVDDEGPVDDAPVADGP
ncbi:hypothetical protein [Brevibacterium yomogidense]|uniref:hypothetical protein n=1 Tax=Brevibacterium yomogidense TaxID=946573 RepID=UPI0018E02E3D|nr:hypothetical protein [Brevibacterium yomogidense]